jgi:hypothetical protein
MIGLLFVLAIAPGGVAAEIVESDNDTPASSGHTVWTGPALALSVDPETATEGGLAVPLGQVNAIMTSQGLTFRQAQVHLSLSDWSAVIDGAAEGLFPTTYAGSRISSEDFTVLEVGFTASAATSLDAVIDALGNYPHANRTRAIKAESTSADLRQLRGSIIDDLLELRMDLDVYYSRGDEFEGDIVLGVAAPDDPTVLAGLGIRYPDLLPYLRLEQAQPLEALGHPAPSLACERLWTSCNPLRGSTLIHEQGGNEEVGGVPGTCTIGFNWILNGANYVVSAGHCGDQAWFHSGSLVGNPPTHLVRTPAQLTRGKVDAMLIPVASQWNISRWLLDTSDAGTQLQPAQAYQITSEYAASNKAGNTPICSGGAASRNTFCGLVIDGEAEYGGLECLCILEDQLLAGAIPLLPGDSGGPMYSNFRAYAVLSSGGGGLAAGTYTENIRNILGGNVRTS